MADLLYYRQEAARWPCAGWTAANEWEVREGLVRFARHFKVKPPETQIRRGTSGERGHANSLTLSITLHNGRCGWLLVAHEFAHTWDSQRQPPRYAYVTRSPSGDVSVTRRKPMRWHCKRHARIVDRVMRYIERQGWHRGGLAEEAAYREAATRGRRSERMAAMPTPRAQKIAIKEAHAKRLRTKIKGLATRLKTVERSLAALRRACYVKGEPCP